MKWYHEKVDQDSLIKIKIDLILQGGTGTQITKLIQMLSLVEVTLMI